MALSPLEQKFILHWGEMGTRWGINRTVAQVHALLYLSPNPLNAEQICEALDLARSNVSTSVKELQNWGIVKVIHVLGDRRDHFESLKDVAEMFRIIMAERKKREVDPTLALLQDCVAEAEKLGEKEAYTRRRLENLNEFFQMAATAFDQVNKLPTKAAVRLVKMSDKLLSLIGAGD